jgi:hypothetical protein
VSSYAVLSDDVGNVTSDGLTALSYNMENHLTDRGLKGVTLDYTYTADGRLIRSERSDTGVVTEIVLDIAGHRLGKLEGGVWRDYVYLGDQLLAYFDDGVSEPVQVIADHIGMPMMVVDGSGTVVWEANFEPFGELRGEVGLSADPGLRYPGQWQDELDLEATCVGDTCTVPGPLEDSFSLFENGYRWYKPGWGRYGQADPISVLFGYLYGHNSPVRNIDPTGLICTAWSPSGYEFEESVDEIMAYGEWDGGRIWVPVITSRFAFPIAVVCCRAVVDDWVHYGREREKRTCECDDPVSEDAYRTHTYKKHPPERKNWETLVKAPCCFRDEFRYADSYPYQADPAPYSRWTRVRGECTVLPPWGQCSKLED